MNEIDSKKISQEVSRKYQLADNTFSFNPKDDPKDRIRAEVGDAKQPEFYPQIKIQRWDNEVNFSARLKHEETNPIVETENDKIKWKGDKVEAHFYDLTEGEGGYEFEVILKEKPKTNKVEFTINTKGLDFFYQPELTQEEQEKGMIRPENVIGSYAVYASENKVNYVGGKEYKCGKVGHIYRPQIEDSTGNKVWGDLNVDTGKGILSVTIPQEFLDNAVYPVRHAAGLTFGYGSIGGSTYGFGMGANGYYSYRFTGAAGSGTSISVYIEEPFDIQQMNIKGMLHLQSDRTVVTNGVTASLLVPVELDWRTMNFGSSPTLTAQDYFVGVIIDNDFTGSDVAGRYDTGTSNYCSTGTNNYTTPTTIDSPAYNYKISIYATYTAGGETTSVKDIISMGIISYPR